MKIGIVGPVDLTALSKHLEAVPAGITGLGGTPVVNLVHGLLERGHRVSVFTVDRSVTSEVVVAGQHLRVFVGRYRESGRARDLFRAERKYLLDAIAREPPEILHAHWTYEFALASLDSGLPTLVTAHDAPAAVLRYIPDGYRLIRAVMALLVTQRAKHLTAVSPYVAEHLRRFGRLRGAIDVVPNGVPAWCFGEKPSRVSAASCAQPVFATVLNGWSRLKNGKSALRAFALVRRLIPAARLLMIGSGFELGGPAWSWARKHECAEGVEFLGSLEHPEVVHTLADRVTVVVHPSLNEAFPMILAEAMAIGVPIIAGERSGGVPFVLGNGTAGVLVDVRSPEAIARAMWSLATDTSTRKRLADEGRHQAAKRFRIEAVTRQYEELYHRILAEAR